MRFRSSNERPDLVPAAEEEALANFREAGSRDTVDARNADAHPLVNDLSGPFDFVFIDTDKDWCINYAKSLDPQDRTKGGIAARNVHERALADRGG